MDDGVQHCHQCAPAGAVLVKTFPEVQAEDTLVAFVAIYQGTYLKNAMSKLTMMMYCTKR